MDTTKAKFPPLSATIAAGLIAGILTVALAATQPAIAANGDGPAANPAAAASTADNRPTGRFLKQPLRFPPTA